MAPCIVADTRVNTIQSPVKKMRKGTRCCTECKRRKIRCDRVDYSPRNSTACMQCRSRNIDDHCRPQVASIDGGSSPSESAKINCCKGNMIDHTNHDSTRTQTQPPQRATVTNTCLELSLKQLIGMPFMDQQWALPPSTKSDKDAASRLVLSALNYCRSVSARDLVVNVDKNLQFEDDINRLYYTWDSLNLPIYATQLIPPKSICDRLVTRYFSSDKAWLRIESFYKEYSEFWSCTQGLDLVKMALVFVILATEIASLEEHEMVALLSHSQENINTRRPVTLDPNRLFEVSHLLIESVTAAIPSCHLQVAIIETTLLQAGYLYQLNSDVKLKRRKIYEAHRLYHLLAFSTTTPDPLVKTCSHFKDACYVDLCYNQQQQQQTYRRFTSDDLCRLNHVRSCIALISQFCTT